MDLRMFLAQSAAWPDSNCLDAFAADWRGKHLKQGATLVQQGQPGHDEYIVLKGCLTSTICDPEGKEVCVGFYTGPCVVAPNIARTRDGLSLVSIAATSDARLVRMDSSLLSDRMIATEPVRNWANAALQAALSAKSDREWCLAALAGAERLEWFRDRYPGYEKTFTHGLIASFLGITPVTLSRLRASSKGR